MFANSLVMQSFIKILVVGVFSFFCLHGCSASDRLTSVTTPAAAAKTERTNDDKSSILVDHPNFTTLVKKVGSSVVNISTTQTIRESELEIYNIPEGDAFSDFLRRFIPPPGSRTFQSRNLGSGFIISADGYILTNAHVVLNTDEVVVKLTNKREYKAKIIGADMLVDVALIKIDATRLPVVKIGNPDTLETGEWVAAIGSPFGFDNSVTSGIVSAKGRALPNGNLVPFIQTDAALNPGSSGGPLFNMQGEVVGINSQIFSATGGYMGLSFAIPIDIAIDVSDQLRKTGKVTRGRIGVIIQELTEDLANSFGLKNMNGALIVEVDPDGTAAKGGIQPGDILQVFDGQAIETPSDLARVVAATKPGKTVAVQVVRNNQVQTLQILIEALVSELPPNTSLNSSDANPANQVGLSLRNLTLEQLNVLGIKSGILVFRSVGAAMRAGIQAGDIILAINNIPINNIKDFERQLTLNQGKTLALLIKRGDQNLFFPLKIEKRK